MTRMIFVRAAGWGTAALAPLSAAAAQTFKEIVNGPIVRIGDMLVYIVYGIAFLVFIFGMFKYFFSSGAKAEENRREGRQLMLWGIVQLFLDVLESWA